MKSKIDLTVQGAKLNRWFLRLFATEDEYIWGGGEQYSYFNLRLVNSSPGLLKFIKTF